MTFLFSDIEGSTQLMERFPDHIGAALATHHELFERLVDQHDGVIFETVGDAVYAAFANALDGVAAALTVHRLLAATDWGPIGRIACRLSVHTGTVERRGDHYFGPALFRCARLQSLGYGEQTLLSDVTARLVRDNLPAGAGLRDLGTHRLKDLTEPERVFMLAHPDVRESFPPPKSIDLHPNNLPTQLSTLVGREVDVARITDLVGDHRLVTLLGPGGVGKTRLVLAAAASLIDRFPDGVFFVDLAPYGEASDIALATATALGIRGTPTAPTPEVLAAWLRPRSVLLVLDNVEQIIGAGPALLTLLEGGDRIRLLVTSRRPVRVRGEERYGVEPLSTDDRAAEGGPSPAVQLFSQRMREVTGRHPRDDELPILSAICRRLDGLPLAIELAAARSNVFDPDELLARLEHVLPLLVAATSDVPVRHQTLRDTIAWSHDLLGPSEQQLLAKAAVFEGGWTMDAWEQVSGVTPDTAADLVDAALVRRRDGRFAMLDTIREFARERLADSEPDERQALRDRHADWFLAWVGDPAFGPPDRHFQDQERIRAVDAERANLRVACELLANRADRSGIRTMALRLWLYWLAHGLIAEGDRWITAALTGSPPPEPLVAAWLTAVVSEFPRFSGDPVRSLELKERAITMAREVGEQSFEAATLADMSSIKSQLGDHAAALAAAERALELRRAVGVSSGIGHALQALAESHLRAGNVVAAREAALRSLDVLGDDPILTTFGLAMLAEMERRLGDIPSAVSRVSEAMRLASDWDDLMLVSDVAQAAGALLAEVGHHALAALALAVAERTESDGGLVPWFADIRMEIQERIAIALSPAELAQCRAEARGLGHAVLFERATTALAPLLPG